jgi:hypothetical protein
MINMQVLAADNLYSVLSLGYADVELSEESNQGLSYKLGFGYQFDPQWYVEVGYQQLIHDNLYVDRLPSLADFNNAEQVQQADALFLAFLGKASGPMGELYYRLGILKTDIRGQQLLVGARECELGQANIMNVENLGLATVCNYDEGGVAGVIGLGFDYFVGARTMIRTEVEYIKGQDNLTITTLNIGIRYNF